MPGFLSWLFGGGDALTFRGHWCARPITLPGRVTTPLGGRVSVVRVCVDIDYRIDGGEVLLQRVRLSRGGTGIMGSSSGMNVAADRTGEAWLADYVCPESELLRAVRDELSDLDGSLRKTLLRQWGQEDSAGMAQRVADALNRQEPPVRIEELLADAGDSVELSFTYRKPDGASEKRRVTVQRVLGESIRALDHKDDRVKNFRIDRITDARGRG